MESEKENNKMKGWSAPGLWCMHVVCVYVKIMIEVFSLNLLGKVVFLYSYPYTDSYKNIEFGLIQMYRGIVC